ncbi:GPW/gp25 family protein [Streptomyces luteogriseus]|uniref:GPW/gp25 family protein n=1 Tax=Streptomyces luteogriseus TaxID=68233 RepID=UPI003799DEA4
MAKQMAIPFSLASDGSIATVSDPVQALTDRVRALVATLPTQRVMRSTFGVSTTDVVFDWDAVIATQQLDNMVRQAIAQWEPSAVVLSVQPVLTQDGRHVLSARVDISAGDPVASGISPQYTITVSANGEVGRSG